MTHSKAADRSTKFAGALSAVNLLRFISTAERMFVVGTSQIVFFGYPPLQKESVIDRRTALSIAVAIGGTRAKSDRAGTAVKMKDSGFYETSNDLDVFEKLMLKFIHHAVSSTSG